MNRSTGSNPDVASSLGNSEAPLCAFRDRSSETARADGNEDIPILAWEVVLNDKSQPWSAEVVAAAHDEANVEHGICDMDNRQEENKNVIAWEVKRASKESVLVVNNRVTVVKAALFNSLHKSFQNKQGRCDPLYTTSLNM